MSTEEIVKDLIDRVDTLKKSDALSKQNQYRIEKKIDKIFALLKDKKDRDRERRF
jgi:hypothetical protein